MDETEITNSEYRQFVHWVRDSILREKLAEMADLEGKTWKMKVLVNLHILTLEMKRN